MTKTAKIQPQQPPKPAKPLTAKQYARMLDDRTEELVAIIRDEYEDVHEVVPDDTVAALRAIVAANYLADKGLDSPPTE